MSSVACRLLLSSRVKTRSLKTFFGWLALGLVTALLAVTFARATSDQAPEVAYLVKSAGGFSLVYIAPQGEVVAENFRTLRRAFQAASNRRLEVTAVGRTRHSVENVWFERERGRTVLFWKMSSTSIVNRLTFEDRADADFFREAFLSGAYSPSPHGHSIYFVRR